MSFLILRIIPILLFSLVGGCGGGKVAAVVNGHVITAQDVDQRIAALSSNVQAVASADKAKVLDQMILETLLLQEANRRGLERDPEVKRLLKEAKRQIMFGRLVEQLRREQQKEVTDDQVAQFYAQNKDKFSEPASLRASHILMEDEKTAQKAVDKLKAGEPFAQVAQEFSTDPSKKNGGDIGFFSQGQVIPEFEEAAQRLQPGETSKIVKSSLGYHIILLTDKKPARERPLEEVQEDIRKALTGQQGQREVENFVQQLRSKAQVKVSGGYAPAAPESAPAPIDTGTAAPSS